jgi:hypothetical protein
VEIILLSIVRMSYVQVFCCHRSSEVRIQISVIAARVRARKEYNEQSGTLGQLWVLNNLLIFFFENQYHIYL